MRFLKRISLFCVFPAACFLLGIFSFQYLDNFFYPGSKSNTQIIEPGSETDNDSDALKVSSDNLETNCDTKFIVLEYDENQKTEVKKEESIPFYFMGLDRESLVDAVDEYEKSPDFHDLEKGFTSIQLISFSDETVVVRKSYKKEQKEEVYYLKVENNKIVVYLSDMETVFLYTDILLEDMPDELQQDIIHVKCINDIESLYDFLESYSS